MEGRRKIGGRLKCRKKRRERGGEGGESMFGNVVLYRDHNTGFAQAVNHYEKA